MPPAISAATLVTTVLLVAIYRWLYIQARQRQAMPPGPNGLPIIGNNHQVPSVKPWRTFATWNKAYGPVVSLHLGTSPVIILGTAEAAWDLLEKRSDKYSSRPRFIMAGEILSDNMRGLMLPNNDMWRRWRKLLHLGFHSLKANTYRDIQSLESKVFMHQTLLRPQDFESNLRRFAASVVVAIAYGRRINSMDEWIVQENERSMDYLTSIPGKYLVESLPWLLYLPRSLQWFRREPEKQKQRDRTYLMYLLNDVRQRMKEGTIPDCLAAQAIENQERSGMSELEIAYALSTPFGAGIGTTTATLLSFFLAMLHYPNVMRKAQAELDSVVGPDRMPEYEDGANLPYINAVVNETLRWKPVAVLGGTPHAVNADDEYQGMFIPAKSTVFANLYGIMQEPSMFPDPHVFLPERFIETDNPRLQTFHLPFGFGRRICPGMHLALNSLYINISRILWAFDILPILDDSGQPVLPDVMNYTNGFNSRPVSFRCRIEARKEAIKNVIERDWISSKQKLDAWL